MFWEFEPELPGTRLPAPEPGLVLPGPVASELGRFGVGVLEQAMLPKIANATRVIDAQGGELSGL